ncbi:hypothetical protein H2200_009920 [Cladophialophora chaetospira]|uniref:Tafazzin n=1 Tax=Cladophialophora chaetospira TaxID=386627 RepID=A0AA38X1Z3_9EURO|nr:hypothetical protein H2200_009920 [Cladophialophora chaetospira]
MPKKHHQRALQIKPQSTEPRSLALSKPTRLQNESHSQRSVNDLIRDSRRLQLRSETRAPTAAENAHSIHPSVRAVLDLPPPPSPAPRFRPGVRSSGSSSGPSRLRRIPGPPPPRSWLTDSIHAPPSVRSSQNPADGSIQRVQVRRSNLPDGAFPPEGSLQHIVMKKIASDWEWHAEQDLDYFNYLPVKMRETLLSYIAVYGDHIAANPLRALFLHETERQERDEVTRLDLSTALGCWTTFKQLERDLFVKNIGPVAGSRFMGPHTEPAPESWDAESDSDESSVPTISPTPKTIYNFSNLKHLSLAVIGSNAKAASWSSLLSLAAELRTLTSLSLAYWPQPTFTPNAASTRAIVQSPGSRPVVYGGSDIYTAYDNNWREAAGILRTLSRSLYCLKWLDLTGCAWLAALQYSPSPSSSPSTSPTLGSLSPTTKEPLGPEWNGGWRGLEKLILEVGWRPVPPTVKDNRYFALETVSWNVETERQLYRYRKDRELYSEIRSTAQSVARHLRAIRKLAGGIWLDVEIGADLEPLIEPKW